MTGTDNLVRLCTNMASTMPLLTRCGHRRRKAICSLLPCREDADVSMQDPTREELQRWTAWGSLPPGFQGRPRTVRDDKEWQIHNPAKDIPALEQKIHEDIRFWCPNHDWV